MAFTHGISGKVFLQGVDRSAYFSQFSVSRDIDTAEVSNFASAGNKQYIAGMRGGSISLEGFFDGTTTGIDAALTTLFGSNIYACCMVNTDALSSRGFACLADITSLEVPAEVGSAVALSAELQATGGVDGVVSIHPMQAETGSPVNGTGVNDVAAATTNGARGHLHVQSTDGSIAVKIQHSSDNVTYPDLMTFVAQAAAGADIQVVAPAVTINKWVRAQWTRTGGTTATFFVGFSRK